MAFTRDITPDMPTTARMTTLIDDCFGQVSRAMAGGASGSEAFTLMLRLIMTHIDRVDTAEGYTKLHTFEVCNGTLFCGFSRKSRVLVSTVTRSERALFRRTDVVLEAVRMAVTEHFPTVMGTLYPASKATDPRPYASLDAMWRAFSNLAHNNYRQQRKNIFLCLFLPWERGHLPRRGAGPPIMGAARAECRPSRFRGRRGRAIVQLSCPSMIHLTLGLTTHRTVATRRASLCRKVRR